MAEEPTPEHFIPYVSKIFQVKGGHHNLTLSNVDIQRPITTAGAPARSQPFNLLFSGPAGDVLPEGLYTLEVEGGPSFELYVMPVQTPARDRQDYQAVFN